MRLASSYNLASMTVPRTNTAAEVTSSGAATQAAVAQTPGKVDGARVSLSPFSIGLLAILVIVLSIGGMAYGGYRAGVQQRIVSDSTAVAYEVQLQYGLAVQDMEIGQPSVAVERLEYILQMTPDYPGAAQMLVKAREAANQVALPAAGSTETPLPAEERLSADEVLDLLTEAYRRGDWSEVVLGASALQAISPEQRRTSVDAMLFVSLRNRGIERIDAGVLELGLTDLEHAEQIMALDDVALQRRHWVSLYLAGMTFWELNWQLTIDNLSILNQIAPNFQDTRSLLREAYVVYGATLLQAQDSCLAGEQFAAALEIWADTQIKQQLVDAEKECAQSAPGSGIQVP